MHGYLLVPGARIKRDRKTAPIRPKGGRNSKICALLMRSLFLTRPISCTLITPLHIYNNQVIITRAPIRASQFLLIVLFSIDDSEQLQRTTREKDFFPYTNKRKPDAMMHCHALYSFSIFNISSSSFYFFSSFFFLKAYFELIFEILTTEHSGFSTADTPNFICLTPKTGDDSNKRLFREEVS